MWDVPLAQGNSWQEDDVRRAAWEAAEKIQLSMEKHGRSSQEAERDARRWVEGNLPIGNLIWEEGIATLWWNDINDQVCMWFPKDWSFDFEASDGTEIISISIAPHTIRNLAAALLSVAQEVEEAGEQGW